MFNSVSRIQKKFNDVSHIQKRIKKFFEKNPVSQFFSRKKSVSQFKNKAQLSESYGKKGPILWVIFKQNGSILRVMFQKSEFNSLSNISKRVQFFESYWKEGFHPASHIKKKGSILWVILFKRKVQFLGVTFNKKNSISLGHIEKKFSSLCHILKGSVRWIICKKNVSYLEYKIFKSY